MRRHARVCTVGMPLEYVPACLIEALTRLQPVITTSSAMLKCPAKPTMPPTMQRLPIVVEPDIPVQAAMAVWAPMLTL